MNEGEKDLLLRAADKLNYYCAEINGDLNDSLAEDIEKYVKLKEQLSRDTAILHIDVFYRSNTVEEFVENMRKYHVYESGETLRLIWQILTIAWNRADFGTTSPKF